MKRIGQVAKEEGVNVNQLYHFYHRFLGRRQGEVRGKEAVEKETAELRLMARAIKLFQERHPGRKQLDHHEVYKIYRELGGAYSLPEAEPEKTALPPTEEGINELPTKELAPLLKNLAASLEQLATLLEREK